MSFITGKPFIEKVLSGLEVSELERLKTLINSTAPNLQGTYRTYKLASLAEDSLSSIIENNGYFKYVSFSYDPVSQTYLKGILCKTGNEYSFFSWQPEDKSMTAGVVTQDHYSPRLEQLTTEEFRRVLMDLLITGGGSDYKTVNFIEFNNISLDEHGEASLPVTQAQFDIMKNNDEECIVVVGYASGAKVQLHRTKINGNEVTFNKINLINVDEFEVGTATFTKINSTYSGAYARKVISGSLTQWFGTQAQYDAIATPDDGVLYFVEEE